MKNRRLLVVSLVLTAMSFAAAHARIFYVAPDGDDSNSGTIESPRRTIQKAAEIARVGDTVLWQEEATDCTIENNIRYRNAVTLGRGDCQGIDFVGAGGGHTIRNNLFFGPGRTSIGGKAGDYAASDNLEDKDPLFVNADRFDFHLRKGSPAIDSDHDGMSDAWERAHGLDANDSRDGAALAPNGYTNVENYLNELAGDTIAELGQPSATPTP